MSKAERAVKSLIESYRGGQIDPGVDEDVEYEVEIATSGETSRHSTMSAAVYWAMKKLGAKKLFKEQSEDGSVRLYTSASDMEMDTDMDCYDAIVQHVIKD